MNLEKAREVALQIRKDEGAHWYQGAWWRDQSLLTMQASDLLERKCGTAGCVAGWTVALEYPKATFTGSYFYADRREPLTRISDAAREVLELDLVQADWLFYDERTLDQVLWALENDNPDWEPDDWKESE